MTSGFANVGWFDTFALVASWLYCCSFSFTATNSFASIMFRLPNVKTSSEIWITNLWLWVIIFTFGDFFIIYPDCSVNWSAIPNNPNTTSNVACVISSVVLCYSLLVIAGHRAPLCARRHKILEPGHGTMFAATVWQSILPKCFANQSGKQNTTKQIKSTQNKSKHTKENNMTNNDGVVHYSIERPKEQRNA